MADSFSEKRPLIKNADDSESLLKGKQRQYDSLTSNEQRVSVHHRHNSDGSENDYFYEELGQSGVNRESASRKVFTIQTLFKDGSEEWKTIGSMGLSLMFTLLLEYLPTIVGIVFVGHEGKIYLDAVSLASMFSNVTGLSIGFGLVSALDTLCAQAFGAGKAKQMGVYIQRAIVVTLIAMIPISTLSIFSGSLLKLIGQNNEVSDHAGKFCLYLLPSLPPLFLYEILRKAMQAQHIVNPMLWMALIGNIINIIFCWLLVTHMKVGYLGVALARLIANCTLPLMLIAYIFRKGIGSVFWTPWSMNCLKNLKQYLGLAIPGMAMMCIEWWSFELFALVAGYLPNSKDTLGAHAVLFSITSTTYMIFLGISISTSIRVGNLLGEGKGFEASRSAVIGCFYGLGTSMFFCAIIILFRHHIGKLFTDDISVIHLVSVSCFALGSYQIMDCFNNIAGGVFRGSGRQKLGAFVNLFVYTCVAGPLSYFLAFYHHVGISGIWWALTIALTTGFCLNMFFLTRTNWNEEAVRAIKRLDTESKIEKTLSYSEILDSDNYQAPIDCQEH